MFQSQMWLALLAVLVMAGGLGGIYYLILKQNAVVGVRTLQLVAIVMIMPMMLALGVLNVIGRETIAPIIAVIVGYALSGFGTNKD